MFVFFSRFIGGLFSHEEQRGNLFFEESRHAASVDPANIHGFLVVGGSEFVQSVRDVLTVFQQDYPFLLSLSSRYPLVIISVPKSDLKKIRFPKFLLVEEETWINYQFSTRVYLIIVRVLQNRFIEHDIPPLWSRLRRIEELAEDYIKRLSLNQEK